MSDDLPRLDGRIVVVSGAGGGGIGTTVTRMAAEAGATVVAVSRSKVAWRWARDLVQWRRVHVCSHSYSRFAYNNRALGACLT